MAVTAHPVKADTLEPVTTFTLDIGASFWRPKRVPRAGDLVVLAVIRPAEVLAGPSGWTATEDGCTFWRIFGPREQHVVTFHARNAQQWQVKGWVVEAGSYRLAPTLAG